LVLGIDFTGGTLIEVKTNGLSLEETAQGLENLGLDISQAQGSEEGTFLIRFSGSQEEKNRALSFFADQGAIVLRSETVGPTFGQLFLKKALLAIGLTVGLILLFVGWRFKDIGFGLMAVVAMIHDNVILLGSFSFLGHFYSAPIDSLFVTAALTVLASSVYDTVVTFGYIKEEMNRSSKQKIEVVANEAINATVVRNINNSWTIIFMLVAVLLLGGETVRWLSAALLIGSVLGAYSSTFLAVPLLISWQNWRKK
jgi:preprotein translocase subunit SecF